MNAKMMLPLAVLAGGTLAALSVIAARPDVETVAPEVLPPLVRAVRVRATDVQLTVSAQGTVEPRTESDLVAEVSGRVIWASPSLVSGGFFEEGEPLLRIDGRDYRIAVERAEAAKARRESEIALANANLERSRSLKTKGVVSDSAFDEAESAARVAEAALREANAALEQARIELDRTVVKAPFGGRVREERVDVGQFVTRGGALARLYAVDYAEIRLPIPDEEFAFLDVPLQYRGDSDGHATPEVVLRARFGKGDYQWRGHIVRTEGEIDPRSRMVHVVARVEDPYGRGENGERPPLAVGLFVEAEILGRRVTDVVVLPRVAMRGGGKVLIVDAEERLRFRDVEILRADREAVVLGSGVSAGERVCVSPLEAAVEGMKVRVVEQEGGGGPPGEGAA